MGNAMSRLLRYKSRKRDLFPLTRGSVRKAGQRRPEK